MVSVEVQSPTSCEPWRFSSPSSRALEPKDLCQALSESIDAVLGISSVAPVEATSPSRWCTSSGFATVEVSDCNVTPDTSKDIRRCLLSVLRYVELANEGVAPFRQHAKDVLERLFTDDVPAKLLTCLDKLDFECQKDTVRLFNTITRLAGPLEVERQVVEYVRRHPRIIDLLLNGSSKPGVFTCSAHILRSCMRHAELVEAFLAKDACRRLISIAKHPSFDIASEAFSSLRELLLLQKNVSAAYLETNFEEFFDSYNGLLEAEDYVTQRQSLKLLGEVLLDRSFMQVMFTYICKEQYLQLHMNLLRDNSRAIQLDAFHVFKVFVANPRKPPRVQQILYRNKVRLVKLLETFSSKKLLDKAAAQDLQTVLTVLNALEPAARLLTPPSTTVNVESEQGILVVA